MHIPPISFPVACVRATWRVFLLSLLLSGTVAFAQNGPGDGIADEDVLEVAHRLTRDVKHAAERERQTIETMRAAMERQQAGIAEAEITPALLEQARLDIDAARSQANAIEGRLQARREGLEELRRKIRELDSRLEARDALPGENQSTLRAELEKKRVLAQAVEALVATLVDLAEVTDLRVSVENQRLDLLQARFSLDSLEQDEQAAGPQRERLRSELVGLYDRAARLREQYDALETQTPAQLAQKRLLGVQTQVIDERAELKQQELKLLTLEGTAQELAGLGDNSSLPVRTLKAGLEKIESIADEFVEQRELLISKSTLLQNWREIIERRGAAAEGEEATLDEQLALMDGLIAQVQNRDKRIKSLIETAAKARQQYESTIAESAQRSLLERRPWPGDAAGWRQLAAGLTSLPSKALAGMTDALKALGRRLSEATVPTLLLLTFAEVAFIGAVLVIRRWLLRGVIRCRPQAAIAAPARALWRNLPGLIPPGILLIGGWLLELSPSSLILLLSLLLIYPVAHFLLDTVRMVLIESTGKDHRPQRLKLYKEARWVVIVTVILAAVSAIAYTVALTPAVTDAISRLTMLLLLLIAVPALHLHAVIKSAAVRQEDGRRLSMRLAVAFSLLVPLVLIAGAIIGLLGYLGLAWTIIHHLGWLAVVAAGWLVARALLRDAIAYLNQRLYTHGEAADFWVQNVIKPLHWLLSVALLIAAGVILFALYEWSSQTLWIRWIPALLGATLFGLGETTVEVSDVLIALVLVLLVFWAGSWSRRVSYRAYGRIQDHGIRQSLSTFTQYAVVVFGLMIVLRTIGIDLTALTIFAGALGIGIGFGLQNIASNFISGILLLIERPLRVSDTVTVENYEGEVTHIGIRALTVRTWDKKEVVIPNSSVISQAFTNWTGGDDINRTVLTIGISYDDDPHRAVEIIDSIVAAHPSVLMSPAHKVLLWEFAESSVNIRVQYYINLNATIGSLDTRSQIHFAIWDKFKEMGITIPYPQRDVTIRALPESLELPMLEKDDARVPKPA